MIVKLFHKYFISLYNLLVMDIKHILFYIKKLIFSFMLLYGLNTMIKSLGIILPINIFNVFIVSFLGVPGLMVLVIIRMFII